MIHETNQNLFEAQHHDVESMTDHQAAASTVIYKSTTTMDYTVYMTSRTCVVVHVKHETKDGIL
jgi:hypothetical protein